MELPRSEFWGSEWHLSGCGSVSQLCSFSATKTIKLVDASAG
jgi:hypothetical protein